MIRKNEGGHDEKDESNPSITLGNWHICKESQKLFVQTL